MESRTLPRFLKPASYVLTGVIVVGVILAIVLGSLGVGDSADSADAAPLTPDDVFSNGLQDGGMGYLDPAAVRSNAQQVCALFNQRTSPEILEQSPPGTVMLTVLQVGVTTKLNTPSLEQKDIGAFEAAATDAYCSAYSPYVLQAREFATGH